MLTNKISTFKKLFYHIKEFYYSGKITVDKKKNNFLIKKFLDIKKKYAENDISTYLKKNIAISETKLITSHKKVRIDNYSLMFESKIFSNFEVKVCNNLDKNEKILIYLPGFHTSAMDVSENADHAEYLLELCIEKEITLITWDWPLCGDRLNNGLFQNSNSIYTAEKEYSKILNFYGSSLFIEYLNEYKVVLKEVVNIYKNKKVYIVGFSMGGFFSYFSSIINNNIYKIISIASLNTYKNLIKTNQTKVNGHYYYPHNAIKNIDLDNIIKTSANNIKDNLIIIYGDKDPNCSNIVKQKLVSSKIKNVYFNVIQNHGHNFSNKILRIIKNEI